MHLNLKKSKIDKIKITYFNSPMSEAYIVHKTIYIKIIKKEFCRIANYSNTFNLFCTLDTFKSPTSLPRLVDTRVVSLI